MTGNKTLWWFVVHSQEETLSKLEVNWEKVKLQTGWTLQKCYMPANCTIEEQLSSHPESQPDNVVQSHEQPTTKDAPSQPEHPESEHQSDDSLQSPTRSSESQPDCQSSSQHSRQQPEPGSSENASEISNDTQSDMNMAQLNSTNDFLDGGSLHHPCPQ